MFENQNDCILDINNIFENETFFDGFRLGMHLMAENIYDTMGDI